MKKHNVIMRTGWGPGCEIYRDSGISYPLEAPEGAGQFVLYGGVVVPTAQTQTRQRTDERLARLCDEFIAAARAHGFSSRNLMAELATR